MAKIKRKAPENTARPVQVRKKRRSKVGGASDKTGLMLKKIRRPWTAWVCFLKHARDTNKFDATKSFGENSKALAAAWRDLAQASRQTFLATAAEDHFRYETERRLHAPPRKPAKAPSSFLFFAKAQRKHLQTRKPELTFQQVATELGREWNRLTPAGKRQYEAQSARAQKVYQTQMGEYKEARDAFYAKLAAATSSGASSVGSDESVLVIAF